MSDKKLSFEQSINRLDEIVKPVYRLLKTKLFISR